MFPEGARWIDSGFHIARQKAYTAVNLAMVEAYWLIGRRIVEEEQLGKERAAYGNRLISGLSRTLSKRN